MSGTVHAFDFLESPQTSPASVCVLFGDEPFLKRLVLRQLQSRVLGEQDEAPFAQFEGKSAEWRDVVDELATVSLFSSGPRLAVVNDADDFVSKHRVQLEDYVARPSANGILVLVVGTWQSNTRLYKAVDKSGLQINCRAPESGKRKVLDESRLCKWLQSWSAAHHQAKLQSQAAVTLLELVGPELGLLDQALAKLALFAGIDGAITREMVSEVVGGWRAKTTWDLLDAAADGDAGEALVQLDRLLQAGENPLALFGQISWSLRRFAAAMQIVRRSERAGRRANLADALQAAGFRPWPREALANAEQQLRQLGRDRAGSLYQWLLEADLALKGSHSSPHRARFVLEQLFLRMAKQQSPSRRAN